MTQAILILNKIESLLHIASAKLFVIGLLIKQIILREVCEHVLAHKLLDEVEAAYLRGAYIEKRKRLMSDQAEFSYA